MKEWLSPAVRALAIERQLSAGQALFGQGDRAAGLYEVVEGKCRLSRVDQEGRELVLAIAGAGETIAEASLFSAVYCCTAVAITKAVVHFYQKDVLLTEFARNPQVAQSFAALLANQVIDLRTRLERRNIHSARDRVRHYLAASAQRGIVILPGTVKDLAGELGLTHEALYRTLSEMEGAGEIVRSKGKIKLVSPHHPEQIRCPQQGYRRFAAHARYPENRAIGDRDNDRQSAMRTP